MSKNTRAFVLPLLLVGSLFFATTGFAQVVEVKIEPDAVYFVPTEKFGEGGLLLTVSGPEDCFLEQTYEPGKVASFGIRDEMGEIIPDGSYTFQVTHRPVISREHQEILAKARLRNDPKEIKELKKKGIVRERHSDAGYFTVFRGRFVYQDLKEEDRSHEGRAFVTERAPSFGGYDQENGEGGLVGAQLADFVINDDLIVDGSACIGFDCVNGESFSFDTIRLKENNLRIKFDDTSVAASFPRTDWQLTANASANGGASKFSIDDISGSRTPFTVEANARSHSLYVDDGGRIGNRTSTPSTEIHTIDGDTPTLRLQQDGSSGFAPQTWDVAGNETNFFIRDVTNGSTLPFRIRPGAPTSSIFIDVDGDVGIGTASPDADFHILRSDEENATFQFENPTINANWQMTVRAVDGEFAINDVDGAGAEFIFRGPTAATPGLDLAGTLDASEDVIAGDQLICNGAAGACLMETSDIRLKPNAAEIVAAAAIIRDLRPIQWSNEAGETSTGLGAQQVAEVMERHGVENWTGHGYMVDQDKHFLSYTALIGVLVGAHQEKDARIAALEAAVEALQER